MKHKMQLEEKQDNFEVVEQSNSSMSDLIKNHAETNSLTVLNIKLSKFKPEEIIGQVSVKEDDVCEMTKYGLYS